jgi:hypothetical protein
MNLSLKYISWQRLFVSCFFISVRVALGLYFSLTHKHFPTPFSPCTVLQSKTLRVYHVFWGNRIEFQHGDIS